MKLVIINPRFKAGEDFRHLKIYRVLSFHLILGLHPELGWTNQEPKATDKQ